jgi:hypothetical protein
MRSVRTVAIGLAAAVCALGAFSATALAKEHHMLTFGKFVASTSGNTKGTGSVSELRIGPYRFTGLKHFEKVEVEKKHPKEPGEKETVLREGERGPLCKPLKVTGFVEEGASESITQKVEFPHCIAYREFGETGTRGRVEEEVVATFTLGIAFRSNHSAETGKAEPESAELEKEVNVTFKGSHSTCKVTIKPQPVPSKATEEVAEKGEKEFEAALYETEEESLEGKKAAEKKFGPFRDRLAIETEFKHVEAFVDETAGCTSKKGGKVSGEEEENEEIRNEFKHGVIDMTLEHITLANGQLAFVPPTEEA